jgi:transketolase
MCFADYARPSMRLSALMGVPVQYVMTHDSIGLGEDGPTHQPVEHLAMLRATPNMLVFRPADAVETAEAWEIALSQTATPSVLALSRQGLPTVRTEHKTKNLTAQGAYVLAEAEGKRQALLMATGSEVAIALAARDLLQAEGIGTRVVSMPCWEIFEERTRPIAAASCPPGRCASRSRPRSASAGTAGSTASAASGRNRASSACTASALGPGRGSLRAFRHHRCSEAVAEAPLKAKSLL